MGGRTHRHGEQGFTLVELLVSLALLGMAAAMLLAGLQMAGATALRERTRGGAVEETVAAQRILRSAIERLRPAVRVDTLKPIVDLRGNSGVLTFVAPPLDRDAPDALQRFRLMRSATGDLTLYSASTRNADIDRSARGLAGWTPLVLARGTTSLSIGYYGPGLTGERGWQDRWWDRTQPPELVRIRVEFPAGDRRPWPDLLVRPRAGLDSSGSCRIDPLTGDCGVAR
jgi:general secretion pathway protein J